VIVRGGRSASVIFRAWLRKITEGNPPIPRSVQILEYLTISPVRAFQGHPLMQAFPDPVVYYFPDEYRYQPCPGSVIRIAEAVLQQKKACTSPCILLRIGRRIKKVSAP
jgi:hypothetical protein